MSRLSTRAAVCLAAAAMLAPRFVIAQGTESLRTQTAERRATAPALMGPAHILSINPFMPLFGAFQGEYERRLTANLSVAVAGSTLEFDNSRYTNGDVKLRLYPDELALEGLGLAAGVGVGSINRNTRACDYDFPSGIETNCRKKETAPSFSVEAQYQWLLGTTRSTAVTLGGGVKRYFIGSRNDNGLNRIMPTLRLTVGYAFR